MYPASCLHISIVTYQQDLGQFADVLKRLEAAILVLQLARAAPVRLTIVDNSQDAERMRFLIEQLHPTITATVLGPPDNLGYGRAHNLALAESEADFHLIMNPDVLVDEDALLLGVEFLESHPDVAALSPDAIDGNGGQLYLCKTYPALWDLFLRGFAPEALKKLYTARLHRYENRRLVDSQQTADVDLISGCFMLCRSAALRQAGGFNADFFLYFEDFALSLELKKAGRLVYLPAIRIVHFGGKAGKKGLQHVLYFAESARKFFNLYGWKLV